MSTSKRRSAVTGLGNFGDSGSPKTRTPATVLSVATAAESEGSYTQLSTSASSSSSSTSQSSLSPSSEHPETPSIAFTPPSPKPLSDRRRSITMRPVIQTPSHTYLDDPYEMLGHGEDENIVRFCATSEGAAGSFGGGLVGV
ncbi:hypothetical protein HK104_011100 [Borealophlyctis nickersoniae]|nr:hypothetical protein HK104_011100 [Borealophlyctis nickersoniae]